MIRSNAFKRIMLQFFVQMPAEYSDWSALLGLGCGTRREALSYGIELTKEKQKRDYGAD